MSPLRWFRRQATWMLIIFGALLMAIFGLGPVFDQMTRGFQNSGPVDDPVIIEYRGGEITRSKLDELQRNHYATRRFLVELVEQASKQCEKKEVQFTPLANIVQPLGRTDNQDIVDEQMLVRKLLAERAEDEGVVISEGMIDDYLSLMAGQADFSPRDWKQINKLVNQRVPMTTIKQHLALELKSMQMQRYASVGIPLNPVPTEAVELYSRANALIECEVVPVSVEDYISNVSGEPSKAEMQALFEEGKYEYADEGMQTPGFKVPRKVNVQYFKADMETFLQNEKSKLTDAQVEAEYEKLVKAEDPIVVEIIPEAEPAGFDINLNEDAETKKDEADSEDAAADLDVKADVPVLKMPDAKTDEPAVPNPEALINEPAVEAKQEGLKVIPAEGKGDQSLNVRKTKRQFTSLAQEDDKQEGDQQEESSATAEETTATSPAVEAENQDEPNSESAQDVGGIGDLQLSDESAGPATGEADSKTRIKPLSEVADEIRTRLARAAAFKKKDDASKRAMIALETYQNLVLRWDTSRDRDTTPKPSPPDFEAIAKDNGLTFQETGLVNRLELSKMDIGKVNFPVQVQSPQGPMRMDFQAVSDKVFLDYDRVDLLIPQNISDIITGNAYVIWMAEKEDVRIPSFAESEEQIKEFWKYQQAVELARKAAEGIAAKASADKKLTEISPETAGPTGEFSWFRPGRNSMATYGNPYGVKQPGEEFMETAFSLENGEAAVAANETRDTIYVIQRTSTGTSVADLGEEYLDDQYFRFKRVPTAVMGAAMHYARNLDFDWNEEFKKSMELKRLN